MATIQLYNKPYVVPKGINEIYNFPPVTINDDAKDGAKRLLVVYGFVTNHDIKHGELHTAKAELNDWGKPIATPSETINSLLTNAGYGKWDVVCIGYPVHRVNELSPAQKQVALTAFDERLKSWVKQLAPKRILFLGPQPLHAMEPQPHVGMLFKYEGVDAVWTIDANHLTVNDETTSSLLGQARNHATSLRLRKNRYLMDQSPWSYDMVDTIPKLRAALDDAKSRPVISLDTEAYNLNRIQNTLISVQIAVSNDFGYFIPYSHYESPWTAAELPVVRDMLREFFENLTNTVVCGAHLKFECIILRGQLGCRHLPFKLYDIAAANVCHDENVKFYSSLGMSAHSVTRIERDHGYERPAGTLAKDQRDNMAAQPLSMIAPYGMIDVFTPMRIRNCQIARAADLSFDGFEKYVHHLTIMTHGFATMEHRGIPIDTPYLLSLRLANGPLRKLMRKTKAKIHASSAAKKANRILLKKAGAPSKGLWGDNAVPAIFDIDNTESKEALFFSVLNLGGYAITKTGQRSIGKKFLQANKAVPEVAEYIAYTEAKKVKTGFVDSFAKIMTRNADAIATKRIRSNYSFLSVLTGRSASSDPNLQNIPARGKQAKLVKRQFVAERYKCIMKQDFNANEVRGAAIVSGDRKLAGRFHNSIQLHKEYRVAGANHRETAKKAWIDGADIHVQNVKLFFNEVITKANDPLDRRFQVKGVVFGTIYGRGAQSLAEELHISLEEAQNLIDLFFETFPVTGGWIAQVHAEGATNYYAVNIFGGRRHLYGYMHGSRKVHKAMDRRGPNSLVQGPLSQIGYVALYEVERMLFQHEKKLNIPLTKHIGTNNAVHDSTELETPILLAPLASYIYEHAATTQIARYFKNYGLKLIVDFEVEQEIGLNLAEMRTMDGTYESMVEHMLPLCDGAKMQAKLQHNIDIIWAIRKAELEQDLRDRELANSRKVLPSPSTLMTLKSSDIAKLQMPDWRVFDAVA